LFLRERLDRIYRIVRIMRPSAERTLAAGEKFLIILHARAKL